MVSNYERGRRLEYRVKEFLERQGYFVVRSAGSKFPDLLAVKDGRALAVEVKKHPPSGKELEELERRARELYRYGVTPCLAYIENGRVRVVVL
jgi:Holliday junction resolvase